MDVCDMRVGALYLLANGYLMRYQGPWGLSNYATVPDAHGLAFSAPTVTVSPPAVGYAASAERVIRMLRHTDLPWLLRRESAEKARNLAWEETRFVIDEIEREHSLDPDEVLRKLREAVTALKAQDDEMLLEDKASRAHRTTRVEYVPILEVVEHFSALDGWLAKGGFLPADWRKGR